MIYYDYYDALILLMTAQRATYTTVIVIVHDGLQPIVSGFTRARVYNMTARRKEGCQEGRPVSEVNLSSDRGGEGAGASRNRRRTNGRDGDTGGA